MADRQTAVMRQIERKSIIALDYRASSKTCSAIIGE